MMHGMKKYFENTTHFNCGLCHGQTQPKCGFGNKNFQTEMAFGARWVNKIMKSQPNLDLRLCNRQAQPKFSGSGKIDDNFENK